MRLNAQLAPWEAVTSEGEEGELAAMEGLANETLYHRRKAFLRLGLNFMMDREPSFVSVQTAWPVVRSTGVMILEQALERWQRGGPNGVEEAMRLCDEALRLLVESAASPEERARAWLRRGQIAESGRGPEQLREAARSHEAGLAALDESRGSKTEGSELASGLGGLDWLRVLLWMNRGNALVAAGGAEAAREALRSYEEAMRLAGGADGIAVVERHALLGAAWMNRGVAERAAAPGEPGAKAEGRCLENAIRELELAVEEGSAPARRNLAGAWLNRAAWCEAAGDQEATFAAWREAARVADPIARQDAVALETGLRARHAFCVAWGKRLIATEPAVAADAGRGALGLFVQVEKGLADFAAWDGKAEASRAMAARLFEFGAWLYRTREPRRLVEFLERHTDPRDARRVEVAREAIRLAQQEILRAGFSEWLDASGGELRGRLQALHELDGRFAGGRGDARG